MNKETKREIRIFFGRILCLVLVLAVSFWAYACLYRGRTEPPTKNDFTNRDAAFYNLGGQVQMLSQKEDLIYFAFQDRKKEREYGTYIVPGLKSTRTLLTSEGDQPAICTSMTPQGLAITDQYVLISAYCHTNRHNSVIYVVDKKTHRFVKEIVLPGQPHAGGLAYDQEHGILWYSSNTEELAQAVSVTMEEVEDYAYEDGPRPISLHQECSLYGIIRDSFMTFYEGCLYVGCFTKYTESAIARYGVDDQGCLVNTVDEGLGMDFEMAVPLDYATISEQAQGMAFYKDKLLLSHSFGILPSRIVVYERSDKQLYVDENSAISYRFPERMEQIWVDGDDLYILFESGAYAYSAWSVNIVDRVLKLSLPKMEEYQAKVDQAVGRTLED
ncbi:MAG: hypothetical protein Q4D55_07280 [Eubacteriales bacterium]|nr:hypothetical protein [Eubacteriales bacterium]